ncbi:hypothetical protein, partial [Pseudobacteriovorax antillogorgiicola]
YETRKDEILYDANWYLKRDSYSPFYETRKDEILYDANWYLKRDSYSPFYETRKDENFYDCLGIKQSLDECKAILDKFRDTKEEVTNNIKDTIDSVEDAFENHPALDNLHSSMSQILDNAENSVDDIDVPGKLGEGLEKSAEFVLQSAEKPLLKDNKPNWENVWLNTWGFDIIVWISRK